VESSERLSHSQARQGETIKLGARKAILKVYGIGSSEELGKLERICQKQGWEFVCLKGTMGRPPKIRPLQKVLDTYYRFKTVRAVARALDIPPPTVSRILKRAGVLESN
jgi:hypothetical protein